MRRLIESLTPDDRQIRWRWVGSVFVLYVVLIVTAAGIFVGQESSHTVAHETVMTVASDGNSPAIVDAPAPVWQAARY